MASIELKTTYTDYTESLKILLMVFSLLYFPLS